ncbi:hypothetical protein GOP47_0025450 [Adiantum capillus-veneris]|uniref:GTD-binding domain-containing protein n=1 Tax=Adiantum capillus-veneris TaxID=13818 RepID=A0A9D4U2T1_ADICA|nr:hypothetical protein GOP47_0025450 [Adiantum capillus-veneris]
MNGSNPWRISGLISACYEFVLALFILFQMLLALLALEVAKFLPVGRAFSCSRHRQHSAFCSGHFPPFSPCRERGSGQSSETPSASRTPTRFSRGLPPGRALPQEIQSSRDASELTFSRKAGLANQARSLSMSSAYKRQSRHNSSASLGEGTSEFKGSVDGETCQCIEAGLDLYDDLIEVSSEYLKQKDRGHEEVILSLLKALQAERRNLRTLYEELEEERVAAETAANEAMAMILRLQEEKSALQMEADHYQRMSEEKALHDEHAIQLLEEDLCRKENERLVLEELLSELRRRTYAEDDYLDMAENVEKVPSRSIVTKPLFLLTGGIDEFVNVAEEAGETVVRSAYTTTALKCLPLKEECCEPLKRFKSFTHIEGVCDLKDLQVPHETEETMLVEPDKNLEKCQPNDDDDAKAILVQLSAVEKQLLALEESEKLELWQQAQGSQDSLVYKLLSPDISIAWSPNVNSENDGNLQLKEDNGTASETEASNLIDEERVVNVDVANIISAPCCETQVPATDEVLEIHGGKRQRNKVVQWDASEEEKHLDLPSFVKRSNSQQSITSIIEGMGKPMLEEEIWDAKRVTLEGINLRLQALESQNTLLRHCSVPSNHEHVNLVLLNEIMQELQELLKANRNVSASNEAFTSIDAHAKGDGQHKKRHYSDGPGQFP